jgi:hypothetical protein
MKIFDSLYRFIVRFRYPVSLPEDVAKALGVEISNFLTFDEFVTHLTSPSCRPTSLRKYMKRESAEEAFQSAQRKEQFRENTIFSYYFNEGWLEFVLLFDEQSRLRRIYLQHIRIHNDRGIEIPLDKLGDQVIHAK